MRKNRMIYIAAVLMLALLLLLFRQLKHTQKENDLLPYVTEEPALSDETQDETFTPLEIEEEIHLETEESYGEAGG